MRISGVALSTIASLFLVCAGCASDVESEEYSQVDQFSAAVPASLATIVEENRAAAVTLNLVDRLIVGDDAVIEFYEPKPGALLVSVAGLAGGLVPDTLGSPEDIFEQYAPERAMAPGLRAALDRIEGVPDNESSELGMPLEAAEETEQAAPVAGGAPWHQGAGPARMRTAAPQGCNNGCCDAQWLSTFHQCQTRGSYSWFLYNYTWSSANNTNVEWYEGLVCSASGTSTYSVSISGGGGGVWSVPQATYRTYWWLAGTTCNPFCGPAKKNFTTSVNSSAAPRLHTYCGWVVR